MKSNIVKLSDIEIDEILIILVKWLIFTQSIKQTEIYIWSDKINDGD